MLMFDTLTRDYLPNYGNTFTKMPNFERLAEKSVTFDEFYGGSMPCMPARRELHTGKYNFLNRSWGPLEPFDESMVAKLVENGIYCHLVTDHSHYFEDGGATFHGRYSTWEGFRGQEGDRWVPQGEADLSLNTCPLNKTNISAVQHLANRKRIVSEEDMPSVKTVSAGLDFIDNYKDKDQWFLQIECFDPHEPFYVPDKYRELYDCTDSKVAFNFPAYCAVDDKYSEEDIMNLRKEYCALLSMCDAQLGRVLDKFDELDLWKDTLLIVNTDHGFFLGEHDYIGKNFPPMFDEVIHTPFFIHYPGGEADGTRRNAVAQTVDIVPTLMEYFNIEQFKDIDGKSIDPIVKEDKPTHDAILFGVHGGQVNIYDGRYVYMKNAVDASLPVYNMTLMPTNMRGFFKNEELDQSELVDGGRYANHHKVLQVPVSKNIYSMFPLQEAIFDKQNDPKQMNPVDDESVKERMNGLLLEAFDRVDAPEWQYTRMGFKKKG